MSRFLNSACEEYKHIISKYLLPVLNIQQDNRQDNLTVTKEYRYHEKLIEFGHDAHNNDCVFFFTPYNKSRHDDFYISVLSSTSIELQKRAIKILLQLLEVTEHNFYSANFFQRTSSEKQSKKNAPYQEKLFDLAFELGFCKWLTKTNDDAFVLYDLISKVENWSGKTYEGKRVPFGFIIDFSKNTPKQKSKYISFLENNNSAVFSDGVFSAIMLDKKGRIISFFSKESTKSSEFSKINSHRVFVPYQYLDIAALCTESAVGVISQSNGDIILIKNQQICFSRRGGKWISFDFNRVYESLAKYVYYNHTDISLSKKAVDSIREIYCTLLDVSFAHTGGCIAIIDDINNCPFINNEDRIDNLPRDMDMLNNNQKNEKLKIVKELLYNETNDTSKTFFDIDRILRKEIMSLDGTIAFTKDGVIRCVGSILKISGSSSSGGARSAAAKTAAMYGVGIKVGEDGFIEAYKQLDIKNNDSEPRIIFQFL